MNIAIAGYATEGKVSCDYFQKRGHQITICDENPNIQSPPGIKTQLGEAWDSDLQNFDLIIRTAGLKPSKILKNNPGIEHKITTAVNEFLLQCPTKNTIGVTGTKGKGTTSTLVASFLEQAGHKVWLAGNIGRSPLEFIDEVKPEDYVVLELSSFQLMDVQASPKTAVCLLVEPEHLDWHEDLDEYVGSKQNIFRFQNNEDRAVFYNESPLSIKVASVTKAQKLSYFDINLAHVQDDKLMIGDQVVCDVNEIKLPGKHNYQNICAAITALHDKISDIEVYRQVITSINPLPYRIQLIATKNGVNYYNDSFSSTPTSTIAAIQAIAGPKILIIGGKDKNNPVNELAETIAQEGQDIKKVIIIGELTKKIADSLEKQGYDSFVTLGINTDMPTIVKQAQELASEGDSIILSPGSSSFDMFKNFQDRGDQFNQAINAL